MIMSDAIVPVHRLMQQQKVSVDWADFVETITGLLRDGRQAELDAFQRLDPDPLLQQGHVPEGRASRHAPGDLVRRRGCVQEDSGRRCGQVRLHHAVAVMTLLENTFAWHDQPFATNQNGYAGLDTKLLINSDFGLMHVGPSFDGRRRTSSSTRARGDAQCRFADGDCAMVLQSSGFVGEFKQSLKFDWGTGQLPIGDHPTRRRTRSLAAHAVGDARAPTARRQGRRAVPEVITDAPQQRWWTAATGYVPVTKSAIRGQEDDDFYKRKPGAVDGGEPAAQRQAHAEQPGPAPRQLRRGSEFHHRFALESIFTGKRTVKEGLDAAVNRGNAILRQFSVSHGAAASGEI